MLFIRTGALLLALGSMGVQAPPSPTPYSVVSREGRRPLTARTIGAQEMVPLDELAKLFDLTLREDALAGGLAVTAKAQTIVLTPGQSLASVGGRLISLPAAPVREGRSWFVPVDFISRALAPSLSTRIEVRRPSRLILVGDIRVPRITATSELVGPLARITFEVAPQTTHAVVQEGQRIAIRFEADGIDVTLPAVSAPELIQGLRTEGNAIYVDLGTRFGSYRSSDAPGERGAGRIILDVVALSTTPPPPAAGVNPPLPTAPPVAPTAPEPPLPDLLPSTGLRTIVVDAGHGGDEDGARGPVGTLEKHVTLSVARKLKAALEARLGVRVILTRDTDTTVGLDERAALANNNKADLFVSLHANASVRGSAAGAEVFYLSLEEYGDQAQRVAKGETESLPVFGGGARDIEVILWEMAQARYIEASATLAQSMEGALRERVPMSPRAIQQAPFRVLVGANMPAVLVEMGFISNPDQEKQLASDTFQNAVVQSLVDGVIRFRDHQLNPAGTPAATTAPPARPGGGMQP